MRRPNPQYFALLDDRDSVIHVECLKAKHESSPPQVLERMRKRLRKEALRKSDEAWLVVDRDQWKEAQLAQLHMWSTEADNYGLALSNPKFEYWVLLHYEDGNGVSTSKQCSDRLKQYLPGYSKGVDARGLTPDMVRDAIRRARSRDNPPCQDWPRTVGTTVYRLVESILRA